MGAFALAVVALPLFVAWLITRTARDRAFGRAAASTTAVITDIRWKTVGPLPERDRLAYPLLRFALPDGSIYEARSEVAAPDAEVGDHVPVLYLPENPSRVRVAS